MFTLHLTLHLAGITLCTGLVVFSKEPNSTVFSGIGSDAVFEWDFSDTRNELQYVIWMVYNKTAGQDDILRMEDENGTAVLSPSKPRPPPAYNGRLERRGKATLMVKNITFEESTLFKCILSGKPGVGDSTSTIQLTVTGPSSVTPDVHFPELGDSQTITCNARGVPSRDFSWKREEQTLGNSSQHSVISFGSGSSHLTIKTVTIGDLGYYTCDATVKDDQPNLAEVYVQVQFLVIDHPGQGTCPKRLYHVKVGEQLSLCCPVSGYPPPIVTWEKNGTQLQKGKNSEYIFNKVGEGNFGNYTCTATNGKDKTLGPIVISVMEQKDELVVKPTDATDTKPGLLKWDPVADAEYYVVNFAGSHTVEDVVIGTETSLEIHYHALVMKNAEVKPKEIVICANVSAMSDVGVLAKTPTCKELTVKSSQTTLNPSVVCLLLLVSASWKLW